MQKQPGFYWKKNVRNRKNINILLFLKVTVILQISLDKKIFLALYWFKLKLYEFSSIITVGAILWLTTSYNSISQ